MLSARTIHQSLPTTIKLYLTVCTQATRELRAINRRDRSLDRGGEEAEACRASGKVQGEEGQAGYH